MLSRGTVHRTLSLDQHVIGTLMRELVAVERSPSAFVVYLYLWSRSLGAGEKSVTASHRAIADDTGLSKSAVQASIRLLNDRRLLRTRHPAVTATPEHFVLRPWLRRR